MLATSFIKARNLLKPDRIPYKLTKPTLFVMLTLAVLFGGCTMVGPDFEPPEVTVAVMLGSTPW